MVTDRQASKNPSVPAKVRRLSSNDVSDYRRLMEVFALAFEDDENYRKHRPTDTYVSSLLSDPKIAVLVADVGAHTVVGGLVAYELTKFERERCEYYIYDLAVVEAFRQQGVTTALIEATKHYARANNAWVVYVQADYEDEPAVNLYTKLGEREEVLHFDISVTS